MRARTGVLATLAAVALVAAVSLLVNSTTCRRKGRETPKELRAEIAALENERDMLRSRMDELMVKDPRLEGMPSAPVRVGVPTTLARDLIQRVVAGFVDQVTLELKNLKVKKSGKVKKVVTIGQYDLNVTINRVIGRLKTGKPDVTFGGNRVAIALPVTVASGSGNATIHFRWDGKNVAGATCGDLEVTQEVSGSVRPDSYPVAGGLLLTATAEDILASPRFPVIKVNLKVKPSEESWGAVQKLLDEKTGLCGYVVEKVNVLGIVQKLIDKGFNVRLPTEKIKPMAVPVGIEPTMQVRGQPVALAIKLGELAITEHMIWLGANVSVAVGDDAKEEKAPADTKAPAKNAPKPKAAEQKAAEQKPPAT